MRMNRELKTLSRSPVDGRYGAASDSGNGPAYCDRGPRFHHGTPMETIAGSARTGGEKGHRHDDRKEGVSMH